MGKVLIVDDDPDVVESLERWFRQDSHQVRVAHDGESALKVIQESFFSFDLFDLVVLDVQVPPAEGREIDLLFGIRLLGALKHTLGPFAAETRVIVHTAHPKFEDCVECVKRGADQYVEKGRNETSFEVFCRGALNGCVDAVELWVYSHREELRNEFGDGAKIVVIDKEFLSYLDTEVVGGYKAEGFLAVNLEQLREVQGPLEKHQLYMLYTPRYFRT